MAEPKRYLGQDVTVTFDGARCLHAARCLRGLPEVFDVNRRPWILPDGAPAERVAEVVRLCPSGALHYALTAGPPEAPERPTEVSARDGSRCGSAASSGSMTGAASTPRPARPCAVAATSNAPYCDASGPCTAWRPHAPGP